MKVLGAPHALGKCSTFVVKRKTKGRGQISCHRFYFGEKKIILYLIILCVKGMHSRARDPLIDPMGKTSNKVGRKSLLVLG